MSLIRKAKRHNIPLKLAVSGPSGSGKSYGALLLAKGLMGGSLEEVVVLDTENKSADLYSHLGDYSVLEFQPPYKPQRYSKAIEYCVEQGFKCVIIDSASHEWSGPGGCLDIHSAMPGNSFANWAKVTPMHQQFIQSILDSPVHIICSLRRKQEYVLEENDRGRMAPKKMGLKEEQRDNFSYELTCSFNIDITHKAIADKDRTGLFSDGVPFTITEETGRLLRQWNSNN